jgi:nucleoside 2-deoxyribosyltransferase
MGARKAAMCAQHGLEGVFPLDAQLNLSGLPKPEQARRISEANEGLMRSCAGLIANLTPFRGVSMDAGTAFEVGFMRALGRPVLGYTNVVADYRARAEVYRSASRDRGLRRRREPDDRGRRPRLRRQRRPHRRASG